MADLPDTKTIDLELEGEWLTIWFNEPEKRNPLTIERTREIRIACEAVAPRRDIRGITFRGRAGAFCAGGDLKAFGEMIEGADGRDEIIGLSREGGALFDTVNALPQVTVMAVEGAAMAGGLGLACVGDVVLVDRNAKFALTETRIGLSPAQIAPFVLQRLGMRIGRRLMLTAAQFDAAEALEIGLADKLVGEDQTMDEAIAGVRAAVLRCAPGAVAQTKKLILALPDTRRDRQVILAAEVFAERLLSEEGREGVAAFVEKRKPGWDSGHD